MYLNKWIIGLTAAILIALLAGLAFLAGQSSAVKAAASSAEMPKSEIAQSGSPSISDDEGRTQSSDVAGQVISTCYHLENCGASKILSVTVLSQRGEETLAEAKLQRGEVVNSGSKKSDIKWKDNYTVYALCSKKRPRIAFQVDGSFLSEEFDLTNVPGVQVDNSQLYLGICHGRQSDIVGANPEKFGYRPMQDGGEGQSNITKPTDLFE